MTTITTAITLGSPRFKDATIQSLARASGDAAAWSALWTARGSRAAEHVAGDFAVGLRDSKGRWFVAVDRFAIRSLCYRVIGNELHVGTRADDLAAIEPRAPIDPQSIHDYLYFHSIPSPRTIFRGVHRLPPGHSVQFEDGALNVAPYWVPSFEPVRRACFESLAKEFRDILLSAVESRLGPGKPACYLSGGTDSSTIAGMVGRAAGKPAATYSIGFEADGYDELAYARVAARRFETEHHEYYVTPNDLVASIPAVAAHYDQPFGNSSAVPAYYCAKMAHDDGVTRILAGDGGDELFGGNVRYAKQRVFGYYDQLPAVLRRGVVEPLFGLRGMDRVPMVKKAVSYVEQARVPLPDRMQMYNLMRRLGPEQILEPTFLAAVDTRAPERDQREVWSAAHADALVDRMVAFDWKYTLADSDLPKVVGSAGLAGLDVAFPLLDDELLAFSMRLPSEWKLKGLKLRWFFKEALRGFLPDEILHKKKHGFGLPFGVWACTNDSLRATATDALRSLAGRGVVRPEFINALLKTHLPAHPGYYGEMVWILMMLEYWLRAHVPGWTHRA